MKNIWLITKIYRPLKSIFHPDRKMLSQFSVRFGPKFSNLCSPGQLGPSYLVLLAGPTVSGPRSLFAVVVVISRAFSNAKARKGVGQSTVDSRKFTDNISNVEKTGSGR